VEESNELNLPSTKANRIKIGITVGDINGIGPEVILKTLEDKRLLSLCVPVVYGSSKVMSYHKNIVKLSEFNLNGVRSVDQIDPEQINVINCWNDNVRITLGQITEEGGRYAQLALDQAVEDLRMGYIDALVTGPINKKAMQLAGFPYSGHTEYLTDKMGMQESLMLMVSEDLRIGVVTNHVPIAEVASRITKERVLSKIQLLYDTLRMDFGIHRPKIAILGLNPHAGDEGAIGDEELNQIIPAIEQAKAKGYMAMGPYSADGFFRSGNYRHFDGILAMYHDQGLIPFKTLAPGPGVNYTAGLPFIRTSPDHGTAFGIVGQNIANHESLLNAIFLALDVVQNRSEYLDMTSNPMEPIQVDNFGEDEVIMDEDALAMQQKQRKPRRDHHHGNRGGQSQ
jgi:4-hydroxythreonine-4-phosphate dehydrogenase